MKESKIESWKFLQILDKHGPLWSPALFKCKCWGKSLIIENFSLIYYWLDMMPLQSRFVFNAFQSFKWYRKTSVNSFSKLIQFVSLPKFMNFLNVQKGKHWEGKPYVWQNIFKVHSTKSKFKNRISIWMFYYLPESNFWLGIQ